MKRSTLIGALIVSLAAASTAMAGPYDHGHGQDRGRDYDRGHDYDRGRGHEYHRDRGETYHHGFRPESHARAEIRTPRWYGGYYRPRSYYAPYGYYSHRWVRGERLPVAFYGRPYVIDDYYGWGLYGPPRGYHWVRVDGDAVLAAIATGIVLDTVFDAFN